MKYLVIAQGLATGEPFVKSMHRTLLGAMRAANKLHDFNPALRPKIYQPSITAKPHVAPSAGRNVAIGAEFRRNDGQ